MTKKTHYTATFADGRVITRSSHRTYTHAYRVLADLPAKLVDAKDLTGGKDRYNAGFAGSADLAYKAARASFRGYENVRIDVVPVVAA